VNDRFRQGVARAAPWGIAARVGASTTPCAACIPARTPAHPIEIWLGVGKPRALALTGRLADGWVPSLFWAKPALVPEMMSRIDDGAAAAGRPPRSGASSTSAE
jgi:alkanesulfonate monooxygenase SsuD/methylene tetrahydromethanopterin reductase-like flavin-dependent oxidoreductase (luciferase family)